MEVVRHILGLCEDNHSHIDLLDLIMYVSPIVAYVSYKWQQLKILITEIINKIVKRWKNLKK